MTLTTYLKALVKATDEEIDFAMRYFRPEAIKKGEFYLREGQIPNKVSFVEKGLFRLFYQLV